MGARSSPGELRRQPTYTVERRRPSPAAVWLPAISFRRWPKWCRSAMRPTFARIDAAAIEANARQLSGLAPDSVFCGVVKAGGYGHGADVAARAALQGGATWLAVATPEEATQLAGFVDDTPILLLSELDPESARQAAAECGPSTRFTIASVSGVAALASAGRPVRVHLKIDTGMHRMGALPGDALAVAKAASTAESMTLEGVWTHLAMADEPDDSFTAEQLRRLQDSVGEIQAAGIDTGVIHAANSAGLIAHPSARLDLVRSGIAMYGVAPSPALEGRVKLQPALELVSRVSAVRCLDAQESVSYGRAWYADTATRVASVPIGYADGIRRGSAAAGIEVLIGGRRHPIVGAVTMDQLMVAVDSSVEVGHEVVLLGSQGRETISAWEIASRLDTIAYEVLTAISARVSRQLG